MVGGMLEVSDCKVGLIGFGDIGQATAARLRPFGCELYYYTPNRKSEAFEQAQGVTYLPLNKLIQTCNILSLHMPVTEDTREMVNAEFLSLMRLSGAYYCGQPSSESSCQLCGQSHFFPTYWRHHNQLFQKSTPPCLAEF